MAEQSNARVETWRAIQHDAPDLGELMSAFKKRGFRPRLLEMEASDQRYWPPTEMLWTRRDLADLKWAKSR